jgi:hypothetical protein
MKRIFIFVTIALFTVGSLFADEAVLIDFTKLTAEILDNTQNQQTMMDFSNVAGAGFTDQQRAMMKTSLAIANWDVTLSSSSRTVTNQANSFAKEAVSQEFGQVMGVRVHFPVEPFNSWALIKPPFSIPAYEYGEVDADGNITESAEQTGLSRFEDGYGVVKNVGTIKSIAVRAHGLNFPHALSAILIDGDGNEKIVFMGYLNYNGWGELVWNNPAYVSEVRNRELRIYPVYPGASSYVRFGGFLVQRDAAQVGGDFIAYFRDVRIVYDQAEIQTEQDIDNEGTWNLIIERENAKRNYEAAQFGQTQVLRYQENQRLAPELNFDAPNRPAATNNE